MSLSGSLAFAGSGFADEVADQIGLDGIARFGGQDGLLQQAFGIRRLGVEIRLRTTRSAFAGPINWARMGSVTSTPPAVLRHTAPMVKMIPQGIPHQPKQRGMSDHRNAGPTPVLPGGR